MSDFNERTEQEREAARHAREQARSKRGGSASPQITSQPTQPVRPRRSPPQAPAPLPQPPVAPPPVMAPPITPPPTSRRDAAPLPLRPAPVFPPPVVPPPVTPQAQNRRGLRSGDVPPPLIVDSPRGAAALPRGTSSRGNGRRGGGPRQPSTTGAPRRRRGPGRTARLVFTAVLVLIIAIVIWFLLSLLQPFAGSGKGTGKVTVTIPTDASTSDIAKLLHKDGVISSSFFFQLRTELGGEHFKSGTYTLAHGMSYGAALKLLTTASGLPATENVTIIPGKSRSQLNGLLRAQKVPGSYAAETRKSTLLNPVKYGAPKSTPSLEGFLYPDTYQVRKPLKIIDLVRDQLTQFRKEMATVNLRYAKSKNLTAYDVLTIASLEDAEAAKPSDLPKVASVIYNRLHLGMDLGLDTTAAYASNNYSGNLTSKQLNSSSRWNTLNHQGLPPTPINSPDIEAIKAAAAPAHTDFLYFIVKVCGRGALSFTSSYDQFLTWSRQYSESLQKRGADKTEFCGKSTGGG